MNVKLLRQFGQRLLAPYGGQGHLRFESRRMVPAGSSAHRLSCSAAILAAVRQKTSTYPTCSKIPSQLSPAAIAVVGAKRQPPCASNNVLNDRPARDGNPAGFPLQDQTDAPSQCPGVVRPCPRHVRRG